MFSFKFQAQGLDLINSPICASPLTPITNAGVDEDEEDADINTAFFQGLLDSSFSIPRSNAPMDSTE